MHWKLLLTKDKVRKLKRNRIRTYEATYQESPVTITHPDGSKETLPQHKVKPTPPIHKFKANGKNHPLQK